MNAGEQLGRRHAECVLIRACIGLLAGTLLGRHVARRPDEIADLGLELLGIVDGLGEPEIEHLRRAFARDHDVARLHVAMNDPRVVRRRERACDASEPSQLHLGRHLRVADERAQWRASNELHHEEERAVHLAEIEDRDGIRMRQRRCRTRLAFSATLRRSRVPRAQ